MSEKGQKPKNQILSNKLLPFIDLRDQAQAKVYRRLKDAWMRAGSWCISKTGKRYYRRGTICRCKDGAFAVPVYQMPAKGGEVYA